MNFNKREIFFLLIGFLYLLIGFVFDSNPTVKEISLFGAEQVLDSKTPYKDFQTIYAPAVFYFNALISSIFSNSLLAIRIVYLFISFFISLLIYWLAKDYLDSQRAFIPFFISIIWQSFIPMNASSVPLGMVLILISAVFLFKYYDGMQTQNSKLTGIIPIGICIGLLGITRQDMASYMYGLFFWAMFWAGMADVEGLGLNLWKRAVRGFLQGVFFTVIVLLTFAPFAIYFIFEAGLDNLYLQLIKTPLATYKELHSIPFPNPFYFFHNFATVEDFQIYLEKSWLGLIFFLPIITAISSAITLFIKNRKKIIRANTPIFWKEILIINLSLNIFNYAVIRSDVEHLLPSMIFSSMLLPSIFAIIDKTKIRKTLLSFFVFLIVFLPLWKKISL